MAKKYSGQYQMNYNQLMGNVRGYDKPERLIVVLDVSGSMDNTDWQPSRLKAAIEATTALIEIKASSHASDEMAIVSYSSHARVECKPINVASGKLSLLDAVNRLTANGSTNIYAGLKKAGNLLNTNNETSAPESVITRLSNWIFDTGASANSTSSGFLKRIILLTDGCHNSGQSPEKIAEKLKARGVIIECIGIGGSPEDVEESLLREIATTDSNGINHYWFIGNKAGLIKRFEKLAGHIMLLEEE